DDALIRELAQTTDRQMAWFDPHVGPDGLLKEVPEWNFIDWAQLDPKSALASLNLQYLMALRAQGALNAAIGRPDITSVRAEKLSKAVESEHWDEKRGIYRDAPDIYSVHTNALALLALTIDSPKAARIISAIKVQDLVQ